MKYFYRKSKCRGAFSLFEESANFRKISRYSLEKRFRICATNGISNLVVFIPPLLHFRFIDRLIPIAISMRVSADYFYLFVCVYVFSLIQPLRFILWVTQYDFQSFYHYYL